MSNQDMIERYVYAVVKQLPGKIRGDVEKELTVLIYDMLEERCQDTPAEEKDVRLVLTELGTPAELAGKYSPDGDKCLIGPPYYSMYKRILKIVLLAFAGGILLADFISFIMNIGKEPVSFAAGAVELIAGFAALCGGLLFAFAFVTLLFAFFQRKGISLEDLSETSLNNLPRPPKNQETVKRGELIAGLIFSVLFLCIMLVVPQIFCGVFQMNGEMVIVPALNIELLRSLWYFIVAFFLLGIGRDIFEYYEGRYTKRLLAVTGACNLLSGVVAGIWLGCYNIMNPEFIRTLERQFQGSDEQIIITLFENFQPFLLIVILFALVLDFGTVLFKVIKYDKIEKN